MKSFKSIFLIAVLFSSIGQISADLYLPSLPFIARGLHTTANLAQTSVALFMFGFCITRLFYGPLSDAIGRKKPLIIGLIICLIGSLVCLFAHNIYTLIIGRLLQGLGAAAGAVLAGAILRDMFEGTALAKYDSYFAMANVTLMASAPLFGGYLQHYFNWQVNFVFLSLYTLLILLVSIFILPETNRHQHHEHLKPKIIKTNLTTLFTNRIFLISSMLLFLAYGAILGWLTAGPVVLQKVVGFTQVQFGWTAALVGGCYFIGALLNARTVGRFGTANMLKFGAIILFVSGIMLLFPTFLSLVNGWVIIVPVMLFVFGSSMIFSNAYAGTMTQFPKIAGLTMALLGTMQIAGGFVASSIISALPDNNQLPLAVVFIICGLMSLVLSCFVI